MKATAEYALTSALDHCVDNMLVPHALQRLVRESDDSIIVLIEHSESNRIIEVENFDSYAERHETGLD